MLDGLADEPRPCAIALQIRLQGLINHQPIERTDSGHPGELWENVR